VFDPDDPAWLWIAMGIALDTEYLTTRGIDTDRRAKWMGNYLDGIRSYYDTTVDIPPAQVEKISYDHNNTIVHSKCPSIIFALDSLVGRPAFERIYKRCLTEYGGKRLVGGILSASANGRLAGISPGFSTNGSGPTPIFVTRSSGRTAGQKARAFVRPSRSGGWAR